MRPAKEIIAKGKLTEGTPATSMEIQELKAKAQIRDMQLDIDILKATIVILKKDQGANKTHLKNKEKAAIVTP